MSKNKINQITNLNFLFISISSLFLFIILKNNNNLSRSSQKYFNPFFLVKIFIKLFIDLFFFIENKICIVKPQFNNDHNVKITRLEDSINKKDEIYIFFG